MTKRPAPLPRVFALALLLSLPATSLPQDSPDDPDARCLKCHGRNLKKTLEDGEVMSLKIDGETFNRSVHRVIGCTGCHRDVARSKHPSREPISSRRAYSLKHNRTCGQCHAATTEAYRRGIHARLVAEGDPDAPVCSTCHGGHAIQPRGDMEPVRGEPCANCHEGIYEAYEKSVHGRARSAGMVSRESSVQAPACYGCHRAHEIQAVAAIEYLRDTCFDCHDGARAAHERWLPNAIVHVRAIACAACHSPTAERRIDLQFYDRAAQHPLRAADDDALQPMRMRAIDPDGEGLDPAELAELLRQLRTTRPESNVTLRGRLEVTTGEEAHRIAPSAKATRECESCHHRGATAFQQVTVSLSRPDGRPFSISADRDVLIAANSIASLGDFYAPGGTRIRALDWLLILAVLAGIAIPAGHLAVGWHLRRRGRKRSDG